tara:strand:- start:358407 stop:359009 length:603 start_codon:yes stop_codon:yes gene_type:complete
MPKQSTFPIILDECKTISISNLRKWGNLRAKTVLRSTITWSNRYNEVTSSCSLTTVMQRDNEYIQLDYKSNGTSHNYIIRLVWLPSNLGQGFGKVWYFICPFTGRRCRKLHLISERFMHRSNLPSGMYECQTKSKKWRNLEKRFGAYFDLEKNYKKLHSKHFKTHYNGKPTKRYLKLMEKVSEGNKFTVSEIEHLLMFGY